MSHEKFMLEDLPMMREENERRFSGKLDTLVRCPFGDCGWCYSDEINEQNGCIGIDECKIKHRIKWLDLIAQI